MANSINILKPSVCFEVQKVIGISTIKGNCKTYQVQWAPSWISGVHLVGCEDLIEQFEHEQNDKGVDIKVETYDECGSMLFDDQNNEVMQDANKPDDSHEQQLSDSHSNADVIVQVSENALGMSHVNHSEDDTHNKDRDVSYRDSSFENNEQDRNGLCRDIASNPDLQYLQTNRNTCNDGSSKDELMILSFQSDELISDNINVSECRQDDMGTSTTPAVGQTSNVGHSPKLPQPVRYFNEEGIIRMVESETINGNERTQINNKLKKTFMCHVCHKAFHNYHNLKIHFKIHSSTIGERQLSCNVCKEKFSDNGKLQVHLCTGTAKFSRPCKCTICEKAFRKKSDLERHIRVHTGERPFKCNICQKSFKQEHYVKTHMRTQHAQERITFVQDTYDNIHQITT